MQIRITNDSVEIEGYVNAIERNSKPLKSRLGEFVERICKGAFKRALQRNDDVHILLNHNWNRDLGSTKQGNLELFEDNIGLFARATIKDDEVINKARNGDLVGWSFGFNDIEPQGFEQRVIDGMNTRLVRDLDLYEVSILDRTKTPAYEGTLLQARSKNNEMYFKGENFVDEVNIILDPTIPEETRAEEKEEPVKKTKSKKVKEVAQTKEKQIDYSKYENLIKEMKGDSL